MSPERATRSRTSSIQRLSEIVGAEDIDLGGRTSPEGAVTIMFSDIEGSTEMVERLGDEDWLSVLREHNRLIRELVARHGGTEVKAQGDGFMLVFTSSRAALRCAIDVQRELDASTFGPLDQPLRVRAGLHAGFAIQEESDFFGRNVILAARIADRARGGEILTSQELKEYAEGDGQFRFLQGQELALKGLAGRHVVYPVDWGSGEVPVTA